MRRGGAFEKYKKTNLYAKKNQNEYDNEDSNELEMSGHGLLGANHNRSGKKGKNRRNGGFNDSGYAGYGNEAVSYQDEDIEGRPRYEDMNSAFGGSAQDINNMYGVDQNASQNQGS